MTDLSIGVQDPASERPNPKPSGVGDRIQELVEDHARYRQFQQRVKGIGEPETEEQSRIAALDAIEKHMQIPALRKSMRRWVRGEAEVEYEASLKRHLDETGDPALSIRLAQADADPNPPIPTYSRDAKLTPRDPAYYQKQPSVMRDWLVEPFARVGYGVMQAGYPLAQGITRMFGKKLPDRDVRAALQASIRSIAQGGDIDSLIAEETAKGQAYDAQRGGAESFLQGSGTAVGNVLAYANPISPVGATLRAGGWVGVKGAELLSGGSKLPGAIEAIVRGASSFGTLRALESSGDPIETAKGAVLGPLFEMAGALGRAGARKIVGSAMRKAGPQSEAFKKFYDGMMSWGAKSGISKNAKEAPDAFRRRVLDAYLDAGIPGSGMTGVQVAALGTRAATEALGFSAIDPHFQRDVVGAIIERDPDKLADALSTWGQNALALAVLRGGGTFEAMRQRQRSSQDPMPADAARYQVAEIANRTQGPARLPRVSKTASDQAVQEGRDWAREELDAQIGDRFAPGTDPAPAPEAKLHPEVDESSRIPGFQQPIVAGYEPTKLENPPVRWMPPDERLARFGWIVEPQEPAKPSGPRYANDLSAREWRASRARSLTGSDSRPVRINGWGAINLRELFPRKSNIAGQLAGLTDAGGELHINPDELRHAAENLVRLAPKWRAKMGDAKANQRIGAIDAFIERALGEFGVKEAQRPIGDRVEGVGASHPSEDPQIGQEVSGSPEPPSGYPQRVEGVSAMQESSQKAQDPQDAIDEEPTDVPSESEPSFTLVKIPGTPFSYRVEDDLAIPSPELAAATGIRSSVLSDFHDRLADVSVVNALHSKVLLPGEEVAAEGWYATPSDESGPAMIRTIRFGEVWEKPINSPGDWKPASVPAPTRVPDQIPEEQSAVVEALRAMGEQRDDLDPQTDMVLDAVTTLMENVSMDRDNAVAETVEALRSGALAPDLAGPPEKASAAIRAIGEMLTTKTPEVAVRSADQRVEKPKWSKGEVQVPTTRVQSVTKMHGATERKKVTEQVKVPAEISGQFAIHKPVAEKPKGWALTHVPTGLQGASSMSKTNLKELARRWSDLGDWSSTDTDKLPLEKAMEVKTEWTKQSGQKRSPMGREGESGAVLADLLLAPAKVAKAVVVNLLDNRVTRAFGEGFTDHLERVAGKPFADRMRRTAFYTTRAINDLMPAVANVRKQSGASLTHDLRGLHRRPSGALYEDVQRFMESRIMARDGLDRSSLSPEALKTVEALDAVNDATRALGASVGMNVHFTTRGPRGGYRKGAAPVSSSTQSHVLVRKYTREGLNLIRSGNAQFLQVIAAENGLSASRVADIFAQEGYTEARPTVRLDALEHKRTLDYVPSHVDIGGKITRVLETDPVRYSEALVSSMGRRVGLVEEFGLGIDGDQPYQEVINQLPPSARAAAKEGFLIAAGSSPSVPREWETSNLLDGVDRAAKTWAAAKLLNPGSIIQNFIEPYAMASRWFGYRNVIAAQAEVAANMLDLDGLESRLNRDGGMIPAYHSWRVESASDAADVATQTALLMFDWSQRVTDLTVRIAASHAVEAMRSGQGTRGHQSFAQRLGYTSQEAERLAKGMGTPEDYDRILTMALPTVTGRGEQPLDRSAASRSKVFSVSAKLLRFAQKTTGHLVEAAQRLREAKTPEEHADASLNLLAMLGALGAAGIASKAVITVVKDGVGSMVDYLSDALQNPTGAVVGGAISQAVGGLGRPIVSGMTSAIQPGNEDAKSEAFDAIVGATAPAAIISEVASFASSMLAPLWTEKTEEWTSKHYAGKSPLGMLWVASQRMAPLLRDIDRGLFGSAALAISRDPDLDHARNRWYSWFEKNAPIEFRSDRTAFGDALKEKLAEMAAQRAGGASWDPAKVAHEIRQLMPKGRDPKSVAASIRRRQFFLGREYSKLTDSQRSSLQSHLGKRGVDTLRGYDKALEILATHFNY